MPVLSASPSPLLLQIIHLKRFQLLGGKWVKSQKIVRFPFKDFDPTDYLSPVPRKAALSFRRSQQQQQQPPPRTASPLVSRRPDPLPHRPGVASPLRGRPDVAELRLSSVASSNSSASAAAGSLPRNGTPLANGDVADAGGGGEPQDHHKHRLHPGYSPLDLKYQMYALAVSAAAARGGAGGPHKWHGHSCSCGAEYQGGMLQYRDTHQEMPAGSGAQLCFVWKDWRWD